MRLCKCVLNLAEHFISVKPYVRMGISRVEIRDLRDEDWAQVRSIYLDGIATGQATFEERAPSWVEWTKGHLPAPRLIATAGENIVGWAALSRVSLRSVYGGVAEVSVYVSSDWRGRGVGRRLLEVLIVESETNRIWTLQASIFPENAASLALHKSCGFREVGRRERIGQMNGVWRDTLLLERRSETDAAD
jgi:phosphinothricin acetyltransferase